MSKPITELIHHPYTPPEHFGAPQPGVYKASTVFFADVAAMRARDWRGKAGYTYGLHGTPTTFMLEERLASLEGGSECLLATVRSDRQADQVVPLGADDAGTREVSGLQRPRCLLGRQQVHAAVDLGRVGVGSADAALAAERGGGVDQHLHRCSDPLTQLGG